MATPEEQPITEQEEAEAPAATPLAAAEPEALDLIELFNTTGYLKEFNQLFEELQGKKVGIFAVCAQPQDVVDRTITDWELRFKCYSDPTHVLRNYLAEQNMVTIVISGGENSTDSGFYKVHPKIKLYKHGVAQPGVVCVKQDRTVLYSWAINPSVMNLGGAADRPVPQDIWTFVQAKLADPEAAETHQDVQFRNRGILSACTVL